MSKDNITLVFDGPAVENGEIDVQDRAPALLAIGELIQAANTEINGNRAQIVVKVRATIEGSFEVDLSVLQSLLESTKALFDFASDNKDAIADTNELADLLFKVTAGIGGSFIGLFTLIQWLRGRKPDKIEHKGGDVHVTINGDVVVVNKKVLQLAESLPVREQARRAVATLSRQGIDTIRIKRPDRADLEITKSEVGFFDYQDTEEELVDEIRPMTLQIISLSFKEDNKWRVTDGNEPFSVAIEDIGFLNKIW